MTDELEVAVDVGERTVLAGIARVDRRRSTTTTSFRYDAGYLADAASYPIDPALPFESLGGVVAGLPGAFADGAPDRWGRRLIAKRIRANESGTPRTLGEIDYLLGVSDHTRQGALRFRRRGAAAFEDADGEVPRLRLPELLRAAEAVASGHDDVDASAVKALLDAGTGTLGGARPKASVVNDDGVLAIAKFPHPNDDWDVRDEARKVLTEVGAATATWREAAAANGIAPGEVRRFEGAFEGLRDEFGPEAGS